MTALGQIGLRHSDLMLRLGSNDFQGSEVCVFSPALAPVRSLTVGSTRTPTLAMPSAFSRPVSVPSAFGCGAG